MTMNANVMIILFILNPKKNPKKNILKKLFQFCNKIFKSLKYFNIFFSEYILIIQFIYLISILNYLNNIKYMKKICIK